MTRDLVLTANPNGSLVAHRLDCQVVAVDRALGKPLCTMFGCSNPLPAHLDRHTCLEETQP